MIGAAFFAGQDRAVAIDAWRRATREACGDHVEIAELGPVSLAAAGRGRFSASRKTVYLGTPEGDIDEGLGGISGLRGPFSLASFDGVRLFLARGRFGGRPLYVGRDRAGNVFASSRFELLRKLLPSALDEHGLAAILIDRPPQTRTLYSAIARLGSAEVREIGPGGERRSALSPLNDAPLAPASADEYAEEMLRLIRAALRRAIGDARSVAVAVGGLDSSGLLALACEMRGATLREIAAMTLDFRGRADDRACVAAMCRAYGLQPVRVAPKDAAPRLLENMVIDGLPSTRGVQTAWNIEIGVRAKSLGADLLVDGEWGDALFDGDLSWFADELWKGRGIAACVRAAELRGLYWMPSRRERVKSLVLRPAVRRLLDRAVPIARAVRRSARKAVAPAWAGPRLRALAESVAVVPKLHDRVESPLLLDIREQVEQWSLRSGCPMSQAYLDDDLIEFIGRLPRGLLFYGGWRRGLFRRAFRGLLPDEVRWREDKAEFFVAAGEVLAAAGGSRTFDPYCRDSKLAKEGWAEPTELRRAVAKLDETPFEGAHAFALWPALAAEALLRMC